MNFSYIIQNHYGFSTEHGHYKAYTKIGGQCWFEFNDDTYREINESSIVVCINK